MELPGRRQPRRVGRGTWDRTRSVVTRNIGFRTRLSRAAASAAVALFSISTATAQEACGLCDRQIVTNSDLATCFLDRYQQLADGPAGAIVVDLSQCPQSRGVVEALPTPGAPKEEPDLTFMVSRPQLACLKRKLEQPGLVLDPSATIDLDSCE